MSSSSLNLCVLNTPPILVELAPIVLFVYNRLEHIKKTVESLQRNELSKESHLHIYSDASGSYREKDNVDKVRAYIRNIECFKSVTIVEWKENYGADRSIICGTTEVIEKYGKIIVLEDDLESHPQFLEYMNRALDKYENNKEVFSITGYSFTTGIEDEQLDETYFLKLTNSWSWATWSDRWSLLDKNATGWEKLRRDTKLRKQFDFGGAYPYSSMLEIQIEEGINTWDILWYWTAFRHNGLTLYPAKSLVRNTGFDGSGVHCTDRGNDDRLSVDRYAFGMPRDLSEKKEIREVVANALKAKFNRKWCDRIVPIFTKQYLKNEIKHVVINLMDIARRRFTSKKHLIIGHNSRLYCNSKIVNPSKIEQNIIVGNYCHIRGELLLFGHGGSIEIGDYCYVGANTYIWSAKGIKIGNRVLISHNCNIFDNDTHPLDPWERHLQFKEIITTGQPKSINLNEKEIVIEDDVLIAANSIILKGVKIGNAAIVGAGSVVTKDVPPYAVVAGNPAKIVRYVDKGDLIA